MTDVKHTLRGGEPQSQYSIPFFQGCINRMLTSFHKYGHVKTAVTVIDCIESSRQRVRKYQESGNTEFLMDAANYLMMEYMHPSHEKAHFDAESRSPGRVTKSGRITVKHSEDL